jgi:hypothetical protein
MSKELEKINFTIGANKETALWVENQHSRFEKGTKLLIEVALGLGEVLATVQNSNSLNFAEVKFVEWVTGNFSFSYQTAYNYISLYKYRNKISSAKNITEAYKMIETLEAQKKQSETANAYKRANEYNKTGVKPEGWRRGTDDKLAKEEAERDQRIEKVKQAALSREQGAKDRERHDWKEELERGRKQNQDAIKHIEGAIAELDKRQKFKEKIRLSAGGMNDPFQDAIIDYLDGLENDSRRIEACYNIIKICKRIANELQTEKGAVEEGRNETRGP